LTNTKIHVNILISSIETTKRNKKGEKMSPDLSLNITMSILLLDRSMSMAKFGDKPISAVNTHLNTMRKLQEEIEFYCGVLFFAKKTKPMTKILPVGLLPNIKSEDCPLESGSYLFESVNDTIKNLIDHWDAPKESAPQIMIGVFSDGEDNSTNKHQQHELHQTAKIAIANGWDLLSFGFGIEGSELAERLGFPTDPDHAITIPKIWCV